MLRIAEVFARREGALALVTGDSLGQVASQTLRNLAAVDAVARMPVFRPLIGTDKMEILATAKKIGTYQISSEPFHDCCPVFMPRTPELSASPEELDRAEANLDVAALVSKGRAGRRLRGLRTWTDGWRLPSPRQSRSVDLLGLGLCLPRAARAGRIVPRRGIDRPPAARPAGRARQDRSQVDRCRPIPARCVRAQAVRARSTPSSRTASTRLVSTSTRPRPRYLVVCRASEKGWRTTSLCTATPTVRSTSAGHSKDVPRLGGSATRANSGSEGSSRMTPHSAKTRA